MATKLNEKKKVQVNLFIDSELLTRFDRIKRDYPWSMSRSDVLSLLIDYYERSCLQAVRD